MTTSKFSLSRVAVIVLFITAVFAPIFIIPVQSVTVDTAKTMLLVVGVVLAFSLFLISVVKRGEVTLPYSKVLWATLLIPAAFLVSALLSQNPHMALFGYNLEVGTWAFVTLGFALMLLSSILFSSRERVYYAYLALFGGFGIVALVGLSKFFLGANTFTLGGVLGGNTPSLVGSWTDLAIFFGAAIILSVVALEELALKARGTWLVGLALAISLFGLSVLNVPVIWAGLLVFASVFFMYTFSFNVPAEVTSERRISYSALVLLVISLLFVFNPSITSSGTKLGDALAQKFNVANVTVSPSIQATYQVTRPVLKDSPILGSGPNSFDIDWSTHKPAVVNSTVFWNASFAYGIGLLSTFFATTGLVGGVLWLLFLAFYIMLGMRVLFIRGIEPVSRFLALSSFLVSTFLWLEMFVTVPSKAIFMLAFFLSGLFIASAVRAGAVAEKTIIFRNSSKLAFVAVLLLVAMLVGNIAYAYSAVRQSVAALYYGNASVAAQQGNVEAARTNATKAANLAGEDVYYSALSQIGVARANAVLASTTTSPTEAQANFQAALSETIAAAQAAVKVRPENYSNWISLGELYESLVPPPLSVQGAYDSAKSAYEEAKKRNPESPEPYYLEARLEVENKNVTAAREDIGAALEKKNDYADAYYLLTQIEIAGNNLQEAIKNARTLAVLQPQNPGVLFQLGLLEYNAADYQTAVAALSAALQVSPDYANAKYFYGLSLDKLGQHDQAIAVFQDLLKTNPDNADLPQIIANIQAGKDPLAKTGSAGSKINPPISDQKPATATH